jgi:hypothetical protein
MPRVSEIASGVQYQFSAEENQIAASTTRAFRVLKALPDEYVNVSSACGIRVGDPHPQEGGLYCHSYSAQYEGDSRMVIVATFNYKATAGTSGQSSANPQQDRNEVSPEVRPANWSISTSLQDVPAYVWKPVTGPDAGKVVGTYNSAGDLYEGIVRLEPIITISVEQFEPSDPTRHCTYAGYVNSNPITLGSLVMFPRSLMFRGVQTQPAVERWGDMTYRGWKANYEFAFRVNYVGAPFNTSIGWDIILPQSGFNTLAWAPPGNATQDVFGQPLDWTRDPKVRVPLALPPGVVVGQKMRACVSITAPNGGGTVQRPSAQPVPLNDDGSVRSRFAPGGSVIVHRYQVQNDIDFTLFGLRLT